MLSFIGKVTNSKFGIIYLKSCTVVVTITATAITAGFAFWLALTAAVPDVSEITRPLQVTRITNKALKITLII